MAGCNIVKCISSSMHNMCIFQREKTTHCYWLGIKSNYNIYCSCAYVQLFFIDCLTIDPVLPVVLRTGETTEVGFYKCPCYFLIITF